jgi:hypothetical protein
MFIVLEPMSAHDLDVTEAIGRTMGMLMSDAVFQDVAFKAYCTQHLLDAVDEFVNQVFIKWTFHINHMGIIL